MQRVTKPGGIIALRESASMLWYPKSPGIEAWREATTRAIDDRDGFPDLGNRIHAFACEAGFTMEQITCSTGSWCFSSPEERAYWGGSMLERVLSPGFSKIMLDRGIRSQENLDLMAEGWRKFIEDKYAWFSVLHGEIICVV